MAKESRTGPESKAQGKDYRLTCGTCDRETVHAVVRSAEYVAKYEDRDFSVTSWDDFQIVECRGCQTVSFRSHSRNTEDIDIDPDTGDGILTPTERLYPSRREGRPELEHVHHLPAVVRRIYLETLSALTNSLPILAGIGIRALTEAMCKDRKAAGRNLEKKLDDLVSQGVVAREGAEILHSLRLMGNQAAHEVTPPSLADLNTAFDVIEHALQGVYILPRLAAKLPRRQRPTQRPGGAT